MSCFVMNNETLAALANAVETRLNCDYNYWGFDAPASLYDALADCKTSCTYYAEDIYRKLYALNVRAYNGRYANHEEPENEEAPIIDGSKYIVHHPPEYREHGFAVSMGNWSQRRLKSWKPCVTYTRTMTLRETSTSLPRTSGLRATDRPTAGICRRP